MDLALILNNLVKKSHRLKTLVTSNRQLNQYDAILIDSLNQPFTLTLPPQPMIGSRIPISDVGGHLSTHPVTLDGNGTTINGSPHLELKGDNSFYEVIYYNETKGWQLVVSVPTDGSSVTLGDGETGCCEPLVTVTGDLIYENNNDIVIARTLQ